MPEQSITFLPLSYAARPPRMVVVAPHDDGDWFVWTAAALARLSAVWGCSGSVVVPASAVGHPAVDRCLARLNPDHVLAYVPSWATYDGLNPGAIDRLLTERGISDSAAADQFRQMLYKEPWNSPVVQEAEAAADHLRLQLAPNKREDLIQCSHLFDDDNPRELTPLAAVATSPLIGVPRSLVSTADALAYAMHVGIEASTIGGQITDKEWREAATRGTESPLLSQLHPGVRDDSKAMRSHEAGLCVPITRSFRPQERVAVLGNQPEDFALAEVLRQIRGSVTWLPWAEPGISDMWLFSGRGSDRLLVTSASLSTEETHQRINARWENRPIRHIEPEEEEHRFDVVAPVNINLDNPFMVVLRDTWDQPRSLPVTVESDGSLQTSLSLAAEVPRGLDPNRHRWQVTLIAHNHPLPPLPALSSTVTATGQNPWETFVRAGDGGVTYWSHRFDFVPSGASLAGSLASPKLAWPGIKRMLQVTASTHAVEVLPSPAGKRAAITERLLGSRTNLEKLAASPGWALLRRFLPNSAQDDIPEGSRWKLKSAVVLSWEAVAAHDDTDWDMTARRGQIDQWTSQGVLRRGLILGCGHCPILEFYPLSEISQSYRCRRCGGENQLTKERWRPAAHEPRWFYDLHPAVLELVMNDGDVPLLATQYLRSQYWARQALVCEEFELIKDGNRFVEMDFALATTEELWVGEAKSNDSLGDSAKQRRREAGKLIEGCTLVGAVGLVLATAQAQWSVTTLEAIKSEIAGRRRAEKPVPKISLISGLGDAPQIAQLTI
ncbi:hypothetical protein [Streptomyces beihaiensis]|uniref:Uncharacterized protein n=1 Tax=Streptomyces beihaiensis TaxID=2984495 RepID=A0ABT3U327_9ACTN|nr:hypothetical protein [Streptomyces beihaiensis]MCX3063725.1 hypothetical protein [Streptomyces beihaiensis]